MESWFKHPGQIWAWYTLEQVHWKCCDPKLEYLWKDGEAVFIDVIPDYPYRPIIELTNTGWRLNYWLDSWR